MILFPPNFVFSFFSFFSLYVHMFSFPFWAMLFVIQICLIAPALTFLKEFNYQECIHWEGIEELLFTIFYIISVRDSVQTPGCLRRELLCLCGTDTLIQLIHHKCNLILALLASKMHKSFKNSLIHNELRKLLDWLEIKMFILSGH